MSVRGRDLALLGLLGAVWGTSFMFISMALREASPLFFAAVRFYAAGALTLVVAGVWLGWARTLPRTGRDWAAILAAAGLFIAGYHGFLFWGQARSSAAVASVIVGLNPILTFALSAALLRHERLPRRAVAGLGVGFTGVALLAILKPGATLDARGVGELAILLAVALWSLSTVLVARAGHSLHPATLSAWQMLVGGGVLHVGAIVLEDGGAMPIHARMLLALGYITLAASVGGFILYYTLLPRLGAVRMNLVSYIVPAFAGVLSLVVLGVPIEPRALVAYGLIAAGFALVALPRRDSPNEAPERDDGGEPARGR